MKNFSLFKQSHCLFAFLFIGIISLFGLSGVLPLVAGTTINFPETDFWVVDHTTLEYAPIGVNPTGIIGYKPNPDNNNPNEYQLTDTISHMTVAMWNKRKIDLNQNWEFNFKLFFGTGQLSYGYNKNKPIGSRDVADGICFVLHNKNVAQNLIGNIMTEMGYGGISHSFAVEFDTEYNGYGGGAKIGSGHHIAYLKDGSMDALPGTQKQMQNNWANVGVGDWFDVKIVWRKVCANDTTYYDLLTYMREKSNTHNGLLLLRDSMRFNSLSEVIAGLTVGSNGQALVTWGITSATCGRPNLHAVDFTRLTTPDVFAPTVTAVIAGRCEETYSPRGVGVSSLKKNIDTILRPTSCYAINSQTLKSDTIEYTISCEEFLCNNEYAFGFHDVPHGSVCKYYLNNELIDSTIYDTTGSHNTWHKPLYREYFRNDSAANIKIIIDSVEYNFRIFSNDKTTDWADELSQEIDIQWDKGMRVGTIEVDSSSLLQSIQLPELAECSYELNPGSSDFATPPSVDSNGVLTFELKPYVCSVYFDINLQCECDKVFTLAINNTSCEAVCDVVNVAKLSSTYNPTNGFFSFSFSTPLYIRHSITVEPPNKITTFSVNEISTSHSNVSLTTEDVDNYNPDDEGTSKRFYIKLSGNVSDTIYKRYEVCTYIEGGAICCDTFEFNDNFSGNGLMNILCKPSEIDISYSNMVGLGLARGPVEGAFGKYVRITIHDFFGNQVGEITDEWLTPFGGTFYYNTSQLVPGQYNVVLQTSHYIESKSFIVTGE